jgi:hypothetical protein
LPTPKPKWQEQKAFPKESRHESWAAAGFIDTLLRCEMKSEVFDGNEKEIQPRVQA